jgi:hypothetical protein
METKKHHSMTYTKKVGDPISLTQATDWTENYRDANPGEIKSHFIGADIINDILAQEGCVGFRVYYALDGNDKKEVIFVGVNSSGDDLYEGIIADRAWPCPNMCPASSPLNE